MILEQLHHATGARSSSSCLTMVGQLGCGVSQTLSDQKLSSGLATWTHVQLVTRHADEDQWQL